MDASKYKLLFFDLDGTLLNSEKNITAKTARALAACREKGIKIGICTSRSEKNALVFIGEVSPDVVISSGGAFVKADGHVIYKNEFTAAQTQEIISGLRALLGADCQITVDTPDANYWNYRVDPSLTSNNWGNSRYCDFIDFSEPSLKICAEIHDERCAEEFFRRFAAYDCIRFSDGDWYKITCPNTTKETAIRRAAAHYGVTLDEIIAFGDDLADMGMLALCGLGVAMGNAPEAVKRAADRVIGTNDEDGICAFLEENLL